MNKYLRQEILEEIGIEGQKKIRSSSVAIIGLGALGTVSAELLTRAGIGTLLLIDKDKVSEVNLHRQLLYKEKHLGKPKTEIIKEELLEINKDVSINIFNEFLSDLNTNILDNYDLILDCTDNMAARRIINNYCKISKKTWIHAAASGVKGNVLLVDDPSVFDKIIRSGETFDDCAEIGVLNSLTVLIASLQVTLAFKFLLKKPVDKSLIRVNLEDLSFDKFKINLK